MIINAIMYIASKWIGGQDKKIITVCSLDWKGFLKNVM